MDIRLGDICEHCVELLGNVPLPPLLLFILSTFLGVVALGYTLLFLLAPRPRQTLNEEKQYLALSEDGSVVGPHPLPCWQDALRSHQLGDPIAIASRMEKAELFLSVVVPAYNEEDRLGGMLSEAVSYLEHNHGALAGKDHMEIPERENMVKERSGSSRRRKAVGKPNGHAVTRSVSLPPSKGWEILIVSDGSTDRTVETALAFAREHQLSLHPKGWAGPWTPDTVEDVRIPPGSIRVVTLTHNRGKGGAVSHGMRHVRGQYVVFADADGASRFDDLGKLVEACQSLENSNPGAIAVGSRAHLVGSDAVVKRSKLRNFLMHSFHLILRLLTPPATAAIKDTQCGFKLFSRAALPYIIPYMHSEGWIFDVEMLMLAEFAGIPVVEVPVDWREVKGSKLNVIFDSLGMAWGLAMLRAAWGFGVYKRT